MNNNNKLNFKLVKLKLKNLKCIIKKKTDIWMIHNKINNFINIFLYNYIKNINKYIYLNLKYFIYLIDWYFLDNINYVNNFHLINYNNSIKKTNITHCSFSLHNRMTIICKRVTQNLFMILRNSKGDILKHISFGYFLCKDSRKINLLSKKIHFMDRKSKFFFYKDKKKYQKKKSELKGNITPSKIYKLAHIFCSQIIPILSKSSLNIKFLDIVLIKLENNIFTFLNVFQTRLTFFNKKYYRYKISKFLEKKYKNYRYVLRKLKIELKDLLSFYSLYTKNKKKCFFFSIYKLIIEYYSIIKFYTNNKKDHNKILIWHRIFVISTLQIENKYLYY